MQRILVVEDDGSLREVLAKALAGEGYRCAPAASAAESFESCAAQAPDLILLDVRLPGADGIAACRRIRADERLRQVPVVMLAGASFKAEHRIAGLESGGDDYIVKPFRLDELLSRIKSVVGPSPLDLSAPKKR